MILATLGYDHNLYIQTGLYPGPCENGGEGLGLVLLNPTLALYIGMHFPPIIDP